MNIMSIRSYRELDGPISHNTYREWKDGFWCAYKTFFDEEDQYSAGVVERMISEFIDFWHEEMDEMDFVQYFISPELRWKYKDELSLMEANGTREYVNRIVNDIEDRLRFEFLMEGGLLDYLKIPYEVDEVFTVGFNMEDVYNAVYSLKLMLGLESKYLTYSKMVVGFLMMIKLNGCFSKTQDKEKYCEYILKCWEKEDEKVKDPELALEYILKAVSRFVIPHPFNNNSEVASYIIDQNSAYFSVDRRSYKCEMCGKIYYVPYENQELLEDMICLKKGCRGKLKYFR